MSISFFKQGHVTMKDLLTVAQIPEVAKNTFSIYYIISDKQK